MNILINPIEVDIKLANNPDLFEERYLEVLQQDVRVGLISIEWRYWGLILTLKTGLWSNRIRYHELLLPQYDPMPIEQAIEQLLGTENMTQYKKDKAVMR